MILFIISLIMICISSYLTASVFEPKKYGIGFIYFLLIAFAQIILTLEILSLFGIISANGVLAGNFIFLISGIIFWLKRKRPLYKIDFTGITRKFKKALIKDKSFTILYLSFLFFLTVTFILAAFLPVNSYDALTYHLARVPFWISNGSLNHFDFADSRIFVMPINSELLYSWVYVFLKNDVGLGLFSFVSFLATVSVLYNFLSILNFSERKKLWAVFILTSFTSVLIEASSIETDLMLGALVLSSIFLYFYAMTENQKAPVFFSALAYAIAMGTKSPAVIALPGVIFICFIITMLYKKGNSYKNIFLLIWLIIINFIIFSSYNYVLNLINYSNPFGMKSTIQMHNFFGGYKAFIANFIRYNFLLIDSAGFKYANYLSGYVYGLQKSIFDLFNINYDIGVIAQMQKGLNKDVLESITGCGVLGVLVFIPCIFYSFYRAIKCKFSKVATLLASLSTMFYINLLVLSFAIGFMIYSVRFVTFFMILTSPILVYSYIRSNKNIYKWIIIFFCFSYMVVISTHLPSRPLVRLLYMLKHQSSYEELKTRIQCSDNTSFDSNVIECKMKREMEKAPGNKNIAFFVNNSFRSYVFKIMENEGWKVDFLLLEDLDNHKIDNYDYIVIQNQSQLTETIKYFNERVNEYYVLNGNIHFTSSHISPCIYTDIDKIILTSSKTNRIPAFSICFVPDEYFISKKFKLYKKFIEESEGESSSKNILIYKKEN